MAADPDDLVAFYERTYSRDPATAQRGSRWRALSAVGKADHVIALCRRAGVAPRTIADIGCGDGALLSELHRRGFGERLSGFEITEAASAAARERPEIESVQTFDGQRLPAPDHSFDLAILSHVLEHVPDPVASLREAARVAGAVLVEVPLEDNLSARRSSKQAHAAEVGHLQRLSRGSLHAIVERAGLRVAAELDDPLPREVHRFFADTAAQRARADAKWAVRAGLAKAAPGPARRLFTVHHACLCRPLSASAGA